MYRQTRIGALRVLDREKFEAEVTAAMDGSEGSIRVAAETLDVSERQLFRWLKEMKPEKKSA